MRERISLATTNALRGVDSEPACPAWARHSGTMSMGWRLMLRLTSVRLVVKR